MSDMIEPVGGVFMPLVDIGRWMTVTMMLVLCDKEDSGAFATLLCVSFVDSIVGCCCMWPKAQI